MVINTIDEANMVMIWLTNEDQADSAVMTLVEDLIKENEQKGYRSVIYKSGNGSYPKCLEALILHNRDRMLQKELKEEKNTVTADG